MLGLVVSLEEGNRIQVPVEMPRGVWGNTAYESCDYQSIPPLSQRNSLKHTPGLVTL